MARSTPWGASQNTTSICRGVSFVSTAGHGGYMVSKGFAKKHLSPAALKRGVSYGGYLCYEEDCEYAIPEFELVKAGISVAAMYAGTSIAGRSKEDHLAKLMQSLSSWNADYLIEIGETPVEPQYTSWREMRENEKMRAEKNPKLIIAALNVGDGMVKVWTADDRQHIVIGESYKSGKMLNFLSDCVLVPNTVVQNILDVQGSALDESDRRHIQEVLNQPIGAKNAN